MGVAYLYGGAYEHSIHFSRLQPDLQLAGTHVELTSGGKQGVFPWLMWNKTAFVAAWYDMDEEPHAIYGSVIDESSTVTTKAKLLTSSPKHTRYQSLLPLGDRVLMVYSDDRDNNTGYEIYARMFAANLEPLTAESRVTSAAGDSVYPIPAFGPAGDVGILFRDDRLPSGHHVFFSRLKCAGPAE